MADVDKTSRVGVVTPVLPGRAAVRRERPPSRANRPVGRRDRDIPHPPAEPHEVDEYV